MRSNLFLKKLHRDERGASMILIIVLIAFLSILLSVLMSTTMFNYQMKLSAVKERENFYIAEKELEDVRFAVIGEVSKALTDSYRTVTEATYASEEERLSAFQTQYKALVLEKLRRLDAVKEAPLEDKEDKIVIKDFSLRHTDEEGYTTSLSCDIAVLVPDADYMKTHGVMEGKDLVVYEGFTAE